MHDVTVPTLPDPPTSTFRLYLMRTLYLVNAALLGAAVAQGAAAAAGAARLQVHLAAGRCRRGPRAEPWTPASRTCWATSWSAWCWTSS